MHPSVQHGALVEALREPGDLGPGFGEPVRVGREAFGEAAGLLTGPVPEPVDPHLRRVRPAIPRGARHGDRGDPLEAEAGYRLRHRQRRPEEGVPHAGGLHGLVQLAESVGLHAVRSPSVELHVSQRELGNMAAGSRESVNKQLHVWQRGGFLELGKRMIVIRDPSALQELV